MRTLISVFEHQHDAVRAADELTSKVGIQRQNIEIFPAMPASQAAGASKSDAISGQQLVSILTKAGVPASDARHYEDAVKHGGTLLKCTIDDQAANRAIVVLDSYGTVDLRKRGIKSAGQTDWRDNAAARDRSAMSQEPEKRMEGYSTAPPDLRSSSEMPGSSNMADASSMHSSNLESTKSTDLNAGTEERRIPVVEEDVRIGKREVEAGGVRVDTHISEKPIEEQVRLREEKVHVERRPVDRPASDADLSKDRGESFELRETVEEPVVQKSARVVEEVVIGKEAQERTETVRDTVRRKDVEVQQTGGLGERRRFEDYDDYFRKDFTTRYGSSGYPYDDYAPAYRYGFDLGGNDRYKGRDWSAIETDVRSDWEQRHPGTWERFKDSIRHAWDRVRS